MTVKFEKTNIRQENTVSHRELLTFTNLTNLRWEFVDLEAIKKGDSGDVIGKGVTADEISAQLNKILTPEVFRRIVEQNGEEKRKYIYGADEEGDYIGDEKGIKELKENAGIAMEYLEKEEGDFLKNWEVVYAADNYKIVADYIDNLRGKIINKSKDKDEDDAPYPSREELQEIEDKKRKIKVAFKVVGGALSIVINAKALSESSDGIKQIMDDVAIDPARKTIMKLVRNTDSVPLELLAAIFVNQNSILTVLKELGKTASDSGMKGLKDEGNLEETAENLKEQEKKRLLEKIITVVEEEEIDVSQLKKALKQFQNKVNVEIVQGLSMFDTGFRVVAFRKQETNEIVVAYKGQRPDDNQALPEEFDYLQIVYSRLKREYSDAKITFTGYEGGGDLSFINSLLTEEKDFRTATLFYNQVEDLKKYINFTPYHIDKDYKSNLEIKVSGAEDIAASLAKKTFYVVTVATLQGLEITSALISLKTAFLGTIVWGLISIGIDVFEAEQIKNIYEKLKKLDLISKEKSKKEAKGKSKLQNKITSYIKDDFINSQYIKLKTEAGKTIRVKKEHGIYLILERLEEDIQSNNNQNLADDEYVVLAETISTPSSAGGGSSSAYYWVLEKDGNNIYEIKKVLSYLRNYNECSIDELSNADRKELAKGKMLVDLIEIVAKMQRNYLKRRLRVEAVYADYDGEQQFVETSTEVLDLSQNNSNYGNLRPNGFLFMPYLTKKEGMIGKNLRPEYKASLLKSIIQGYMQKKVVNETVKYQRKAYDIAKQEMKYGLIDSIEEVEIMYYPKSDQQIGYVPQEFSFDSVDYSYDFDEDNIYDEFFKIIKSRELKAGKVTQSFDNKTTHDFGNLETTVKRLFNYYEAFLQDIKDNKKILEDYYAVEEVEEKGAWMFSNITGTIILNPMPDKKKVMEYKYNPKDYIIGGELELTAKDIPDKVYIGPSLEYDFPLGYMAKASDENGKLVKKIAKKAGHSIDGEVVRVQKPDEKESGSKKNKEKNNSAGQLKVAVNKVLAADKNRV